VIVVTCDWDCNKRINNPNGVFSGVTRHSINRTWETIRENIEISAKEGLGYYELKKHKPWFDEGCSELLDQRKRAKLQWLQDPSEINGDNLNNIRREGSRHFRNKEREC
jgi:hypothetical protein